MPKDSKDEKEETPESLWNSFEQAQKEADEEFQRVQDAMRQQLPAQSHQRRMLWAGAGIVSSGILANNIYRIRKDYKEAILKPMDIPLDGPTPRQLAEAYASAALMKATYLVALFGIACTSFTFAAMNVGSVREFNQRIHQWIRKQPTAIKGKEKE